MQCRIDIRPSRSAPIALALLLLAAPVVAADAGGPAPVAASQGGGALEFTLRDINPASPTHGRELTLSEVYGDGGVVVDFLASWCKYCWDELPELQKLHNSGEIPVLGIAADESGDPRNVLILLERHRVTLPVLWVPEELVPRMEQVYDHEMLPAVYLIGAGGAIQRVLQGKLPEGALVRTIRQLLDGPASAGLGLQQ